MKEIRIDIAILVEEPSHTDASSVESSYFGYVLLPSGSKHSRRPLRYPSNLGKKLFP